MRIISGNIFNHTKKSFIKGHLFFDSKILKIEKDETIKSKHYILPGLIDAHIHIESSMLSPIEYSKESLRHGVIAAITDPHEIANVCGVEGILFMISNAEKTPMKIFTGVPSCVPATEFENSGSIIGSEEIESLFRLGKCSHLSEMMNFPDVISGNNKVHEKIKIAKKYGKKIDGHAPLVSGSRLKKYFDAGISTDHECTNIEEAVEKILLGMKIMLRESSASRDFNNLDRLIELYHDSIMFCTDDCHPDQLKHRYIDDLVKRSLIKGYSIFNIIDAVSINVINHYNLNVGFLNVGDYADFIVVDDLKNFKILKTFINGGEVYDGVKVNISDFFIYHINNFYINNITQTDIKIKSDQNKYLNVIEVIPDSLLTKKVVVNLSGFCGFIDPDIKNDILKIVVINRYFEAKPAVGFIKGFGIKNGAIGGSVAHDSHNIIVIGSDDDSIIRAINLIQNNRGGLVVINSTIEYFLPLPIAGLMSDKSCDEVAKEYQILNNKVFEMGSKLNAPFMTLSFMSLLVIPEIKIGDRGLFDGNQFKFIDLLS